MSPLRSVRTMVVPDVNAVLCKKGGGGRGEGVGGVAVVMKFGTHLHKDIPRNQDISLFFRSPMQLHSYIEKSLYKTTTEMCTPASTGTHTVIVRLTARTGFCKMPLHII